MNNAIKILYVEDEPDIRTVASLALEKIGGFNLLVCASGIEAMQKISDFQPDLVLLDVMMPEMDGLQTYEMMRKIPDHVQTPVIFMTARTQQHEIEQYYALGAIGVIGKPFSPLVLTSQVQDYLAENNVSSR